MAKTVTSALEIIAIHKKLEEVLLAQDDGTFIYENGWNDEAVAKSVAPRLRWTHVQSIRRKAFGHLYKDIKPKTLSYRVEELEKRVANLELLLKNPPIALSNEAAE